MEPQHYLILGLVVGGALGAALGWLAASRRRPVESAPVEEELRRQLARQEEDLERHRGRVGQFQSEVADARARHEAAESSRQEQERRHAEQLRELKAAQERLMADAREVFRGLSAEALKEAHPEFLRLANETFARFQETAKGDLSQRQESIKTLVEPLRQQLESYQRRLQQNESAQASALGEIKKQMEMLSGDSRTLALETQQFRMVLRSNHARGRWGEETLRRVVEASGLSVHCDFTEQTQEGDVKPDMIVRLPGDRLIIVDAKVPDLDFLAALEGAEASGRTAALKAHADKLKGTVKALADRDYPGQFTNALDHVVLFVPAESLFSAALEGDPEILVWAAARRILLATPASLIALLRSVSVSWQQHDQTVNAREIAEAAEELYVRVGKFTEHLERIRSGLDRATLAFNEAVGSYERKIRPSGERLLKLGVRPGGKTMAEMPPLETPLRLPEGDS